MSEQPMACFRTLQAIGCALLLAGCTKPAIIKEPYKVTEVREVYRPIPDEYTRTLKTPELPEGDLTCKVLADGWLEWTAFGKTANEHRTAVKQMTKGN